MHFVLPYLYSRHAVVAFDKQLQLDALVGDQPWHFDVCKGVLAFGEVLYWHAQVLGTESDEAQTWLWARANEGSNIPPTLLQASQAMKALGDQRLIEELTEPVIPLDELDGHFFAVIASGIYEANAYYRAPYRCTLYEILAPFCQKSSAVIRPFGYVWEVPRATHARLRG